MAPVRAMWIAWINTGTGLRYKVVLDRAMDIADAFFITSTVLAGSVRRALPLHSHFQTSGIDLLKTFGGGLVTTCGLTHIRGPERTNTDNVGYMDAISNIPAEIESGYST